MSMESSRQNQRQPSLSLSGVAGFFLLFFRAKPAPAAVVTFHGYTDYAANYEELAIALGHPGKKAPDDECDLVRGLIAKRPVREGSLNLSDSLFLAAVTSILSPPRVIEVGTGTGFSSALIATILRARAGTLSTPFVETIDLKEFYRGDETVATVGDIGTLIPEFASAVRTHSPRQSDFVDQLARPNELQFGFIDANHQHPCPLLDLLRVARVTQPGGWIALHDVALGSLVAKAEREGRHLPFRGDFGAEWLFEMWPFGKVKCGNSGVIRIPARKRAIQRVVKSLMKLPLEVNSKGHPRLRREVMAASRAVSTGSTG
jgi:hypothetical protein